MSNIATTTSLTTDSHEGPAWESVQEGWHQLYGDFPNVGISIEEHNFRNKTELNWARSFHPDSLEICLNLTGNGQISIANRQVQYVRRTAGYYAVGRSPLSALRHKGERHHFLTIELSRQFLETHLVGCEKALQPVIPAFLAGKSTSIVSEVAPLSPAHETLALSLRNPQVAEPAKALWYQGKVLEAIAHFLFLPPGAEMFCSRQKRMSRERIETVMMLLRNNLVEPLSLTELAKQTACSPFYLSRIFSEETGSTIPQFLRQIRMQRAAELLRSGSHNVTEVCFMVGYSSLGHFSKSFCDVIGCCPSLYPHALNARDAQKSFGA